MNDALEQLDALWDFQSCSFFWLWLQFVNVMNALIVLVAVPLDSLEYWFTFNF